MIAISRIVAIIFVWVCWNLPVNAYDWDCTDWESKDQTTMNICSYEEYVQADKELNEAWKIVKPIIDGISDSYKDEKLKPDVELSTSLLEAQRSWIKFRDSNCLTHRNLYFRGTIAPMINNLCRTKLTKDRTKALLGLVERYR